MKEPVAADASASCPHTAFSGHRRIASGSLPDVALAVKRALGSGVCAPILIYDDATGRAIDIDTRGNDVEVVARLPARPISPGSREEPAAGPPRGPGRPKLGVIAREVTLLPRHWEWLNGQPGGASVALRKLVEEARRTNGGKDRHRQAQEAAFHFMSSIGGDLPGFEEAIRALFANDRPRFSQCVASWPEDVRTHASQLAFADRGPSGPLRTPTFHSR